MNKNKKAIFDNGDISNNLTRRDSYLKRLEQGSLNFGKATASGVIDSSKMLANKTIGNDAPEIVQSHKNAALMGLLGGPVGYVIGQSVAKHMGGALSTTASIFKNKYRSAFNDMGSNGGGGGFDDGGYDDIYDGDGDDDMPKKRSTKKSSPKTETYEVEEIFSDSKGVSLKRKTFVKKSKRKKQVVHKDIFTSKQKGRSSPSPNGDPNGSFLSESIGHNKTQYNQFGNPISNNRGGSNKLSHKDLLFITSLSKSITSKLERSDKKRQSFLSRDTFGKQYLEIITSALPSLGGLNVNKYYLQLPSAKKVGVFNSINMTLGLMYASNRAMLAESHRLLYSLITVNKMGMNVSLKVKPPSDVTTITEFLGKKLGAAVKLPYRAAKFGLKTLFGSGKSKYGLDPYDDDYTSQFENGMFPGGGRGGPRGRSRLMSKREHRERGAGRRSFIKKSLVVAGIGALLATDPFGVGMPLYSVMGPILADNPVIAGLIGVGLGSRVLRSISKGIGGLATNEKFGKTRIGKFYQGSKLGKMHKARMDRFKINEDSDPQVARDEKLLNLIAEKNDKLFDVLTTIEDRLSNKCIMFRKCRIEKKEEDIKHEETMDISKKSKNFLGRIFKADKEEYKETAWHRKYTVFKETLLGPALGMIGKGLTAGFSLIASPISSFASLLLGYLGIKTGGGLFKGIGSKIGGLFKGVGATLSKGFSKSKFGSKFLNIIEKSGAKGLSSILGKGAGIMGKGLKFVGKGMGPLGAIASVGLDMYQGTGIGEAAVGLGGGTIGSAILGGIGTFIMPGIGTAIGAGIGYFIGDWIAKKFYPSLKNALTTVGSWIKEKYVAIVDSISTSWDSLTSGITGRFTSLKDSVYSAISSITDGIFYVFEAVNSKLKWAAEKLYLPQKVIDTFGYLADGGARKMARAALDRVKSAPASVYNYITNSPVVGAITGAYDDTTSYIGNKYSSMTAAASGFNLFGSPEPFNAGNSGPTVTKTNNVANNSGIQSNANIDSNAHVPKNDRFRNYIKDNEGRRLTAYKDAHGYSIGYGHFIKPDEKHLMNGSITPAQADMLFEKDFQEHYSKFANSFPGFHDLSSPRQLALVDMSFNMGPDWWKEWKSTTSQIMAGNWGAVKNNILDSKYAKQVGRRANKNAALLYTGKFGSYGAVPGKFNDVDDSGTFEQQDTDNSFISSLKLLTNWGADVGVSMNDAANNFDADKTKKEVVGKFNAAKENSKETISKIREELTEGTAILANEYENNELRRRINAGDIIKGLTEPMSSYTSMAANKLSDINNSMSDVKAVIVNSSNNVSKSVTSAVSSSTEKSNNYIDALLNANPGLLKLIIGDI